MPVPYGSQQRPASGYGSVGARPEKLRSPLYARNIFMVSGVVVLFLLCIVPIWNSLALMRDNNYMFWVGDSLPMWIIVLCCLTSLLYMFTILFFFRHARPQVQTEQTIMMIANVFITFLGLVLMLVSLPLSRQAIETYNNLMHRCDYSEQTHRMYEYSQVLQNIRATPACASKYSVEECVGYESAEPYTGFLKTMEEEFRCSGFCYRTPQQLTANLELKHQTSVPGQTAAVLAAMGQSVHKNHHEDHVTPISLLAAAVDSSRRDRAKLASQSSQRRAFATSTLPTFPPTLFSDANYQASCEGMAARDMKNFAGDIGFQTFYQGIYLVLIAIATGFLKLIGYCVRRDHDQRYADAKAPGAVLA